jgi:hypothetical protein
MQLRLASPGLLHVKKIYEWTKRNSLHPENHPEVKYFSLTQGKIRSICGGLDKSKMSTKAMELPTQTAGYTKSVAE